MSRFKYERFDTVCTVCDGVFSVVKSRLEKAKFCSRRCMTEAKTLNDNYITCEFCGGKFKELAKHRDAQKRHENKLFFCSKKCQFGFRDVSHPIGTKRICSTTKFVFVKVSKTQWRAEHRLVAESKLKRKLNYASEPILHINGLHYDNDPSNIYVCKDQSELNIILKSYDIPYPVKSNLDWYK